ncbi:insulinase family protein, partial [Candidatus Azambacteria bacterium]|nr:insulinase family protein [Candidatus Azambacteria bacterium]
MFKRIILPNGLRFIHVPMNGTQTVTVLVMAATGSKYETKEKNGISHFLEHMIFKGTRRRPTPAQIHGVLNEVGAIHNAFTAHEWTGYFVKVPREHTKIAVDVVSDVLLHALFPSAEIDRERGAVIAELNMYRDDPMRHVEDLFYEVLYGDQPAGWNVGGRAEVIQRITRKDFLEYLRDHYRTETMAVIIAGNISEAKALRLVKKYFAGVRKGKGKGKLPVVIRQARPEVKIASYPHADQGHLR